LHMATDLPENYEKQLEAFQFIRDVPVDWKETRVLNAEIGEYLTIVRKDRNSDDWYLGSITNEKARVLNVKLDFLDSDKSYIAEIYEDAASADWKENPLAIRIRKEIPVNNTMNLSLLLAPGGGSAICFRPMSKENLDEYDENGPVKDYRHPDPSGLVNEYLKRDGNGEFMQSNPWKNSALLHTMQPGWDQSTLISGYEIDILSIDSTRAVYDVIYHVIARISQNIDGPFLIFNPNKKITRFELKNTPWGWRIAEPNQHQHILPNVIIGRLPEEDQKKLKAYLEQKQLTHLLE